MPHKRKKIEFFSDHFGLINPFRAPEPLPILNPGNFVPKNGFPVLKGLIKESCREKKSQKKVDACNLCRSSRVGSALSNPFFGQKSTEPWASIFLKKKKYVFWVLPSNRGRVFLHRVTLFLLIIQHLCGKIFGNVHVLPLYCFEKKLYQVCIGTTHVFFFRYPLGQNLRRNAIHYCFEKSIPRPREVCFFG